MVHEVGNFITVLKYFRSFKGGFFIESEVWIIGEVLYFGDAESESELDRVGLGWVGLLQLGV